MVLPSAAQTLGISAFTLRQEAAAGRYRMRATGGRMWVFVPSRPLPAPASPMASHATTVSPAITSMDPAPTATLPQTDEGDSFEPEAHQAFAQPLNATASEGAAAPSLVPSTAAAPPVEPDTQGRELPVPPQPALVRQPNAPVLTTPVGLASGEPTQPPTVSTPASAVQSASAPSAPLVPPHIVDDPFLPMDAHESASAEDESALMLAWMEDASNTSVDEDSEALDWFTVPEHETSDNGGGPDLTGANVAPEYVGTDESANTFGLARTLEPADEATVWGPTGQPVTHTTGAPVLSDDASDAAVDVTALKTETASPRSVVEEPAVPRPSGPYVPNVGEQSEPPPSGGMPEPALARPVATDDAATIQSQAISALTAALASERERAERAEEQVRMLEEHRAQLARQIGYFQRQMLEQDEKLQALQAGDDMGSGSRPWWAFWRRS